MVPQELCLDQDALSRSIYGVYEQPIVKERLAKICPPHYFWPIRYKDTHYTITIGIPVYNCERYIKQAVMSVLNQSYKDFELIITDDGSTDNTLSVLNDISDPRLKVLSDGENHGISYRLNQQIDLARGKYFARMDGDDIMFPDRIEKQLNFLLSHEEMDACGSRAVVIGSQNEIIGMRGTSESPNNIAEVFMHGHFIHPTVMGRTEWFRKYRYREDMCGCEDLDLWIRSHNDSCIGDMDVPSLFYRDPLVFKLKTFMKRQRQIAVCYWENRSLLPTTASIFKCYTKLFITVVCCFFLWMIRCDRLWIKRRNVIFNPNEILQYEKILCA